MISWFIFALAPPSSSSSSSSSVSKQNSAPGGPRSAMAMFKKMDNPTGSNNPVPR